MAVGQLVVKASGPFRMVWMGCETGYFCGSIETADGAVSAPSKVREEISRPLQTLYVLTSFWVVVDVKVPHTALV